MNWDDLFGPLRSLLATPSRPWRDLLALLLPYHAHDPARYHEVITPHLRTSPIWPLFVSMTYEPGGQWPQSLNAETAQRIIDALPDVRLELFAKASALDDLLHSATSPHIHRLYLTGTLSAQALTRLTHTPHLHHLKHLALIQADLTEPDIARMTSHTPSFALQSFNLNDNAIKTRAVQHLLRWPALQQLEQLYLHHTNINWSDVTTLLTHIPSLSHLQVSANGLVARTTLPTCLAMEDLNLGLNPLGDDGLLQVLSCPKPSLKALAIGHCQLTHESLDHLQNFASNLPSLHTLDIQGNDIHAEDILDLLDAKPFAQLRELTIGHWSCEEEADRLEAAGFQLNVHTDTWCYGPAKMGR